MANWPANSERPARKATLVAIETGDQKAVYDTLTVRQRRFAEEYILDYNAKAAAIRAGYAVKHAEKQASALLKHQGVAFVIDCLTRSKEAKIVSVDPDYIIQQVLLITSAPEAKHSDRLRGLELLARHLGMFTDKMELTGKDGGPLEHKKVEEDAQTFTNLLKQLQERADNAKKDKAGDVPIRSNGERLQPKPAHVDRAD